MRLSLCCAVAVSSTAFVGCTSREPSSPIAAAVAGGKVVVVSPSDTTLFPGQRQQFSAQLLQNGSPKNASFTWRSSDTSVATVSATGLATAVSPGEAIISATTPSSLTGTARATVRFPPPVARFTFVCTHLSCTFDAGASTAQASASYTWVWGDSTAADTGKTASHLYARAGTYGVTLTVADAGGSADTTQTVTVAAPPPPPPVARFTFSCVNLSCAFDAGSSTAQPTASFAWAWGDGTAGGIGKTATHTYGAAGTYAVRLVVMDSGGSADTTQTVAVTAPPPPPPVARWTFTCSSLACAFDASASTAQTNAIYRWVFGDGTPVDTGKTLTHTYGSTGSYGVTLSVTDGGGTDDTTQTVTVTAAPPPPAIVATIPLSRRPIGSTVGPNGTGWIGQLDTGTVQRLDVAAAQFTGAGELGSLLSGPATVSANDAGTRVYAVTWGGLVGSINTQTLAVEHSVHLPINFNNASNIIAMSAGDTAFVGMTSGEIYKVDLQSEAIVAGRTLPIAAGYHFAWNPARTRLYASARDADGTPGRVYELDPATLSVPRAFDTNARPQGIAFSADGALLYIANELGGLLVWNVAGNVLAGTITTGCRGFGLLRRPDTGWLYVTCALDGRVVVVDPGSGATIVTLATGGRPREPSFDPGTGSVIVPNEGGWVDIIR